MKKESSIPTWIGLRGMTRKDAPRTDATHRRTVASADVTEAMLSMVPSSRLLHRNPPD
jgi:hypothetical protein